MRVIFFCTILSLFTFSQAQATSTKERKKVDVSKYDLQKIKADIILLNLVNGLNLTPQQMRVVYYHANHYTQHLRDSERAKYKAYSLAQKALWKIYNSVSRGKVPSPHVLKGLKMAKKVCDKAEKGLADEKILHRWGIQKILREGQKEALRNFKACLLPPKDFKNPVRVGQALNLSKSIEFLKKYRTAGPFRKMRMERRLFKGLRRAIVRKAGVMDEGLFKTEADRMKKALTLAVKLTEVQFQLQKNRLAGDLGFHNPKKVLHKEIKKVKSMREKQRGKEDSISQIDIFLRVNALPILEKKYKLYVKHKKGRATDLKKIKGVKDCNTCAVK